MNRLMVYGSLKKTYWNHVILEGSEFLGEAKTTPVFTMIDYGAFPAILPEGKTAIHGEIYDISDATLVRTDRLEGHPGFYTRTRCNTTLGEAWIYLMKSSSIKGKDLTIIESGLWKPSDTLYALSRGV
jgi:gamma-glutamylaminecyclotransferase